jgi:hypothetical protein
MQRKAQCRKAFGSSIQWLRQAILHICAVCQWSILLADKLFDIPKFDKWTSPKMMNGMSFKKTSAAYGFYLHQ